MANLTAERIVPRHIGRQGDGYINDYDIAASEIIYKGALVAVDATGNLISAGGVLTHFFVGIALETIDNSAGSAGDLTAKVLWPEVFRHALASATKANIGDAVYASDDQTVVTTSTGVVLVGHVISSNDAGIVNIASVKPGQPAA